jgi:hypothetical protein
LTAGQLTKCPVPEPLIAGILAVDSLAVLYGEPGVGKTFAAIEMALSVVSGLPCFGRAVRRGPVVYIAAEGSPGALGLRVRAWKKARQMPGSGPDDLLFIPEPIDLLDAGAVRGFIDYLTTLPALPVLLVVDTLAECMVGGDENSAKDMGTAVAALKLVKRRLGCAVLANHHPTKKAPTRGATMNERGSSALRGAADTMLMLSRDREDREHIRLEGTKQREAAAFEAISLKIQEVELGEGESSCILEPAPDLGPSLADRFSVGRRRRVLRLLVERGEGLTYMELREQGIPDTSLRRDLEFLTDEGYVAKPPISRGGKYLATARGKTAYEKLTAKQARR